MSWKGLLDRARALRLVALLSMAAFGLFASPPARAQVALGCSFGVTSLPFGSIANSFAGPYNATATASVSGCVLAIPQRLCINIGAGTNASGGQQRMINTTTSTSYYKYNIYTDTGRTLAFGSNVAFIDLTLLLPSGGFTIYGQLPAGQTSPGVGSFSDTLASFTYAVTSYGSPCPSPPYAASLSASLPVSASVVANCTATTPGAMGFGSVTGPQIAAQLTKTTTLTVTCNTNAPYAVYADNGQNSTGSGDPLQRRMTDGASHYILYNLYKSGAYTSQLGSNSGNGIAASGNGGSQTVTIFGAVPAQSAPYTGTYTDSVAVTVQF